jgi:hypothetical protein
MTDEQNVKTSHDNQMIMIEKMSRTEQKIDDVIKRLDEMKVIENRFQLVERIAKIEGCMSNLIEKIEKSEVLQDKINEVEKKTDLNTNDITELEQCLKNLLDSNKYIRRLSLGSLVSVCCTIIAAIVIAFITKAI